MEVLVVYESTRGRTQAMAKAICEGVRAASAECSLVEAKSFSGLGVACAIAIGSSTRMKKPLPRVKQVLSEIDDFHGLPAAAFGSYGWSGEAPGEIAAGLTNKGAKMIQEHPLRAKDYPSEEILENCRNLGKQLVSSCAK